MYFLFIKHMYGQERWTFMCSTKCHESVCWRSWISNTQQIDGLCFGPTSRRMEKIAFRSNDTINSVASIRLIDGFNGISSFQPFATREYEHFRLVNGYVNIGLLPHLTNSIQHIPKTIRSGISINYSFQRRFDDIYPQKYKLTNMSLCIFLCICEQRIFIYYWKL